MDNSNGSLFQLGGESSLAPETVHQLEALHKDCMDWHRDGSLPYDSKLRSEARKALNRDDNIALASYSLEVMSHIVAHLNQQLRILRDCPWLNPQDRILSSQIDQHQTGSQQLGLMALTVATDDRLAGWICFKLARSCHRIAGKGKLNLPMSTIELKHQDHFTSQVSMGLFIQAAEFIARPEYQLLEEVLCLEKSPGEFIESLTAPCSKSAAIGEFLHPDTGASCLIRDYPVTRRWKFGARLSLCS